MFIDELSTTARERDIENTRKALPPSLAAKLKRFKEEQKNNPILNGRPYSNQFENIPISLVFEVFHSIQTAMASSIDVEPTTYKAVKDLLLASSGIYDAETDREAAIREPLRELGILYTPMPIHGANADSVIAVECGTRHAYVLILEIKNEIGEANADPYNQVGFSYRTYWSKETGKYISRLFS